MKSGSSIFRRDVISWALYDFANTIYSMNILSKYFAVWLVIDLGFKDIYYSLAFSGSMMASAIIMPALGYVSDVRSRTTVRAGGLMSQPKLFYLFILTVGAVGSVIVFSFLPVSLMPLILIFFALSNFCFEGGIVFYNALLDSVSTRENVGRVSGFGVAFGYLGSIVGMILVLPFVTGDLFGLKIPFIEGGGRHAAFLPTAIFFAIFAIPIFLYTREDAKGAIAPFPLSQAPGSDNEGKAKPRSGLAAAYRDVWKTIKATEKYPGLMRFIISDFFFEDAIATVIIFMVIYLEKVLGMGDDAQTLFLILSTVFAMVGAYIMGYLSDRFTPKKVLFGLVLSWIISLMIFAINDYLPVVWLFGPIVGILLGGVWASSRPLLMQLTPPEKLGEFFGLFSLSGRAAAIIGPLLWGGVVYFFSFDHKIGAFCINVLGLNEIAADRLPYRLAILALAAMMAVGLFIFRKVPERKTTA